MKKYWDYFIRILGRDNLILVSFGAGLLINIILWIVLIGKFHFSAEQVPLHFNVVYGIDFVGAARNIYQIPLAGLIIWAVNFFLVRLLSERERLLSYFLSFAALVAQILLGVGAVLLVLLNS